MTVLFLLDNREWVAVAPEALQLRQISQPTDDKPEAPYTVGLGIEVTVPVNKEDGTPDTNEDGTPKTQQAFRPLINYGALLTKIPAPAAQPIQAVAVPAPAAPAATPAPAPATAEAEPTKANGLATKKAKKSGK
jgi:hypothetical protein